jgi:hypothetical protein
VCYQTEYSSQELNVKTWIHLVNTVTFPFAFLIAFHVAIAVAFAITVTAAIAVPVAFPNTTTVAPPPDKIF